MYKYILHRKQTKHNILQIIVVTMKLILMLNRNYLINQLLEIGVKMYHD